MFVMSFVKLFVKQIWINRSISNCKIAILIVIRVYRNLCSWQSFHFNALLCIKRDYIKQHGEYTPFVFAFKCLSF